MAATTKFDKLEKWNPKQKPLGAFFRDSLIHMATCNVPANRRAAHLYLALQDGDREAVQARMAKENPPAQIETSRPWSSCVAGFWLLPLGPRRASHRSSGSWRR